MKQMLRQAEREVMREAVQRAGSRTTQLTRRERCRVSREFLERLLCGPREVGFDSRGIRSSGKAGTAPLPPPPFPVDEYSLLLGSDDEDEEFGEKPGYVPSLVELCCVKMAENLMVYGFLEEVEDGDLPTPPDTASVSSSSTDESDDEGNVEDEEED